MADRYWVGGTANWDGTAGTKWAATSGGPGGQSVPTSADDVYFDAASGAAVVTIAAGNTGAKSINCTGFTGTLTGTVTITISGSITLVTGMTFSHTGTFGIFATSTITSAGKTFGRLELGGGAGNVFTFADALSVSGEVLFGSGTINTGSYNATIGYLNCTGTVAKTINLGSSVVTASNNLGIVIPGNSNTTLNAGTSSINLTGSAPTVQGGTAAVNGQTFYNVSFTSTSAGTSNVQGINTFNNLTITAPAAAGVRQVTFDSRQTINGTLSTTGTAGNERVWFRGATYGLAQTLTINSTPSLTDADFRDIIVTGTAAPISGTRIGDLRGNQNITFSTPKTVYWTSYDSGNWSGNNWGTSSLAEPSTDSFPLAQDTAVIQDVQTSDGLARRNLLGYPQDITQSNNWLMLGTAGASRAANVTTAPDGTSTADIYRVGTGTGSWYIANYANAGIQNGVTYTFSVYIKAAGLNFVFLRPHNNSVFFGASGFIVDLTTGAITYPSSPLAPASTGSVVSLGDGWWRISATSTANATVSPTTGGPGIWPVNSTAFLTSTGTGPANFTGDGTSGVYIWGAQLEVGSSATAYQNIGGLNTGNTITMDSAIPYTGTVSMATRTSAMTLALGAGQTIYGDWINGAGTTVSNNQALTFSGRKVQNITSAGKTFGLASIVINSLGGTVRLVDTFSNISNNIVVTNGTFDTNNQNVSVFSFISSNSNVRTINLGSSVLTGVSGGAINFAISTNLTFNAGTSQINLTGTENITFEGGGQTFYNVSFTGVVGFSVTHTINGANSFNNLTFTATSVASLVQIILGANQNITGTLTVAGASAVRRMFLRSNPVGTVRTLTVGTLSANDCDFRDITIAGAAAGTAPTRAGDCGGNSGVTFPAPKTVYWNLAGSQNWSATAWAPGTGGTPDINNFPLAQDTAVFDEAGAVGTVALGAPWNIGTFNASARTSAMTLTMNATASVYGNWTFGTGVTSTSSASVVSFFGRGTATITSNGIQFGHPVAINSVTGTVQLGDALSLASIRALSLTSGTFDAVSYNVTAGLCSITGSTIRTLKMGSGTWTLTGTGTVWDSGAILNLAFYKGTANIVLSDTSTSARTFSGGSLSYNKLTIGGTTGTSTLTIIGNNQFTELASTKTVAHTIDFGATTQTFGKWTVTGSAGNVVTLTGTGTSHVLAGAATSGIDYLAMGSIGFAATSPGEFYAGANSTGTAGAPVFRTAPPAGATRYWVGGTGNWSDTNRWSTGSGGGGGASVPTSLDDVVFDNLSNATAYTATIDATSRCKKLTIAGPGTGNVTLAGTAALICHDNVTLPATGLTRTYSGQLVFSGSTTGKTITSNGVGLANIDVNGVGCEWKLNDAFACARLAVLNGSIDFNSYNASLAILSSTVTSDRTITCGASTVTVADAFTPLSFGTTENARAALVFNAGTSQLTVSGVSASFVGNNQTFYNVSFTNTGAGTPSITGNNSFNNLSFTGLTSAGLKFISLSGNQTVTGTLTFSAGTNATMRHFVLSDTIGTTRTITAAAFSGTDVDFRDITIAGAAAPVSGTRFGDCKGNSGITFDAPKTVYVRSTGTANWSSSTGWSATEGGAADVTQFPLAQDTVIFPANTYPASGSAIIIDQAYNIGTIDMSQRTSNTVTLSLTANPVFYGNLVNGTGTTGPTNAGASITFAGRTTQSITTAGKTFNPSFIVNSPSGSVVLQDALVVSPDITITQGTFNAGSYNVTAAQFSSSNSNVRTIAFGSGTMTFTAAGNVFAITSTNATITGTGTISLTSGSAKTFGGSAVYTNMTLNQGGAGTLTFNGNNTFKDITNTYKTTGATTINFTTSTQTVSQFTATGEYTRVLTLTGTSSTSAGTLVLTGTGKVNADWLTITGMLAYSPNDTWYAGYNSTNNGSLGWLFSSTPESKTFFLMFT